MPYGAFVFFVIAKLQCMWSFVNCWWLVKAFVMVLAWASKRTPAKKFIFVRNLYGYSVVFYWCSFVHVVITAVLLPCSFAVCSDLPSFITVCDCGVLMQRWHSNGNMLKEMQHMLYTINISILFIYLLFGGSVQVECSFLCQMFHLSFVLLVCTLLVYAVIHHEGAQFSVC